MVSKIATRRRADVTIAQCAKLPDAPPTILIQEAGHQTASLTERRREAGSFVCRHARIHGLLGVFSIVRMAEITQSAVDLAENSLLSLRVVGVFKLAGVAQVASEGEWTEF